ncbi:MAG: mechanosensitive ion channel family protein [Halanaeroarchaeum sp.]
MLLATVEPTIRAVTNEFVAGVVGAIPRLLTGALFLVLAYVLIRLVLATLRRLLDRAYPDEQDLVVDLTVLVVGLFLWFGAGLTVLKLLGMETIAASLGSATGFIGLGIAFALKEMIADTVAGVYLLQDPNFTVGDRVDSASVTGRIERIDLRKTRIRNEDGDLAVVSNRDVEKKWTQKGGEGATSERAG